MMPNRKTGYSPLNAESNRGVPNDAICAQENKHSAFWFEHLFLSFYDLNLNTQGFVYLEFVMYQLGLHRNVQVFAKCNVCISAIQLFSVETCPGFFPLSNAKVSKN